jgi:hypothetical protein
MSEFEEQANRLLRLAIENFERAECAIGQTAAAQFRAPGSRHGHLDA